MHLNTTINVIFLCILNASSMLAGIYFNSLVIMSLWRSSQLRKELCYFMILVLSCFDLAVVGINHPILILSTILWSTQSYHEEIDATRTNASILLGGFSMFALLTLNIERFLALTRPFFHQTAVTKLRLTIFLALQMTIVVALSPLYSFYAKTVGNVLLTAVLLLVLFAFIFMNYKMLTIAKSKRKHQHVAPADLSSPRHKKRKKQKEKYKSISTCSLAVGCFFICFCPEIIGSAWRFTSKLAWNDRKLVLIKLWSNTFGALNSTLNCLIFFWRNSTLRREGMKTAKCLRSEQQDIIGSLT